jgi:hypothetical protein
VTGPFDGAVVCFRFLYSFKETDFFGVAVPVKGDEEFWGGLLDEDSADRLTGGIGLTSRLRLCDEGSSTSSLGELLLAKWIKGKENIPTISSLERARECGTERERDQWRFIEHEGGRQGRA